MAKKTKTSTVPPFDFLGLRKKYRLTQAELADMVKVSKNYICQIETGRKVPSQSLVELAQRIEHELAVSPPLKNPSLGSESSMVGENPAIEYVRKLWKAAQNDRHLEGYLVTQLKLTFPLDKAPFASDNRQ